MKNLVCLATAIALALAAPAYAAPHGGGGAPHAVSAPHVSAPRAAPTIRSGPARPVVPRVVQPRGPIPLGRGEHVITPRSRPFGGHAQHFGHGRGFYPGYGPDYEGPCWIFLPALGWVDVCDPLDN